MALFMMLKNLLQNEKVCEYFNLQTPKNKKNLENFGFDFDNML